MKTHELLAASEEELSPQLKTMKLKELERHANKILNNLGCPDYDDVLRVVIKAIRALESDNDDRFSSLQDTIKNQLPLASNDDNEANTISRLTILMTMIVTKKFEKIHNSH